MNRLFLFLLILSNCIVQAQEGFVPSKGVEIYYQSFSIGTPILIINGGPGMNSKGFTDLAKMLSANNRTIIYDQRGTGRSVMPVINASNMTMQLMVEDIETLRKHLNIDRWIVMGHSFGGMLASYYATLHPEAIIAMILSSSGGIDLDLLSGFNDRLHAQLTTRQSDALNQLSRKMSEGDTSYATRFERAKFLANANVVNKSNIPVIAERLMQVQTQINSLLWQDMQQIAFNCAPGLSRFDKPALILQGKQDILSDRIAIKAQQVLKKSTLVFLDHTAHYGWLDNKQQFLDVVNKFLKDK